MNLGTTSKILLAVYGTGVTAHLAWAANRGGVLEVASYNKSSTTGQEVGFVTAFEAFWSGLKWNTFWTFIDSWFWPVKFMAFFAYLAQSHYTPERLGMDEL